MADKAFLAKDLNFISLSLLWHLRRIQNTTVQIFNSCTGRPDLSKCLFVQTPMDDMSMKYAKHINDPRCLRIKATFSCKVIHTFRPRKLCGNQACGRVL